MARFHTQDALNLLSKLTFRRVWNGVKVWSSYYWSKWTRKPVQWGYPVSISFEPTNFCNLRCPECPSGLRSFTRPTGMLQRDFFRETIDDLHRELAVVLRPAVGRELAEGNAVLEKQGVIDANRLQASRDLPCEHIAGHEGQDQGIIPRHLEDDDERGERATNDRGEHGAHTQQNAGTDDPGIPGERGDPRQAMLHIHESDADQCPEHAA